jgi:outer membrane receptor for ferrienterochelin and colicin
LISYTGYSSQKVSLTAASNYEVTLSTDAVLLSDVVVVAFGTAAREKFTGSATTISSEQIANRPISNVAQAIVGASPGVQTNAGSGQPGAAPEIRIRGFGSINASNDPLYVVDGCLFLPALPTSIRMILRVSPF